MPLHLLKLCVGCDSVERPVRLAGRAPRRGARRRHAALRLPRHPDAAAARGRARRRRLALLGDPRPRARPPARCSASSRARAPTASLRCALRLDPAAGAHPAATAPRLPGLALPAAGGRARPTCPPGRRPTCRRGSPSNSPRSECSDMRLAATAFIARRPRRCTGRRRLEAEVQLGRPRHRVLPADAEGDLPGLRPLLSDQLAADIRPPPPARRCRRRACCSRPTPTRSRSARR